MSKRRTAKEQEYFDKPDYYLNFYWQANEEDGVASMGYVSCHDPKLKPEAESEIKLEVMKQFKEDYEWVYEAANDREEFDRRAGLFIECFRIKLTVKGQGGTKRVGSAREKDPRNNS